MKRTQANLAYRLALKAHDGQTRWNAFGFPPSDEPYINHAVRVALAVDGDGAKAVALLHDVLEDTDVTYIELERRGVEKGILLAVRALTRLDDETYREYIERLATWDAEYWSGVARVVKLADLDDNLSDLPGGHSLRKRYEWAKARLGV
jgi:(p)ppGpp synthase/HD superfamily hydrolase